MDTGSDFVWFPCTHKYTCRNCSFPATQPPQTFIPKQSSTSRIVGCLNKKCGWVHNNPDVQSRCADCSSNVKNCSQICPPYLIIYGSGSTGGISIVDNLNLPGKKVPDFLVGCSLFSSRQPAGIAGFGRGPTSLPNQLGLKKFSYCLLSHKFDDLPESSSLVLYTGKDSDTKTSKLSYTPIVKLPEIQDKQSFSTFSVYYYIGLRKITVGGEKIKIPFEYLTPGPSGNGGTIVDSGSTFTFLTKNVHDLVVSALVKQVKDYKRAKDIESVAGLRPCFNISGYRNVNFPEMKFHFKGGAEMIFPLANYFSFVSHDMEVVCLTMVTDEAGDSGGPAIILGNYQLQNFYTEFDLGNERFGFRQQLCL